MLQIDKQSFVVFDLDDTLYKENAYHDSGLKAVSSLVRKLYGVDVVKLLLEWKIAGVEDLWGRLCQELNLPMTVKESFIWQYRLHCPDIALDAATTRILGKLEVATQGIAIITDGRSVTQRLKLAALGLNKYPVYVSEEWLSMKPSKKRFVELMVQYLASQYIYIGDNPQKDFKAANDLGWLTIGLLGDESNIHYQGAEYLSESCQPALWINSLEEIGDFIC